MAKDEVRWVTSSGGMFVLCADWVLEQGGSVSGAVFAEDFRSVRHTIIDHWTKLPPLMKSKYVQSDTNTVFTQIEKLLETTDKPVLFCGCPCQVAGLYGFLGGRPERLITLDLLCHSIGSPKAHRAYLDEMTFGETKPIANFYHKTKDKGWGAVIKIEYANGEIYYEDENGSFYKSYLSDLNTRRCCHVCPYTTMKRVGDISIGDFWGIGEINPQFTDKKGTSLVFINSEKGNSVFQKIKKDMILCEKCDERGIAVAKQNNRPLSHPAPYTEMRRVFFNHLDKNNFSTAVAYGQRQGRQDVGLVGWWNGTNFGSTLTSYALFTEIIDLGFSPVFVTDPVATKNTPPYPNLTNFSKNHFSYSLQRFPFEMYDLNNHCDMFLVGSDQLWNYDVFSKKDYFFMLNFVDDRRKKISYATSFAHSYSKFPEFELPKARHLLQRFDYVSVREDDGVKICSETFGVEATHVLDPVFICDKNKYLKLANGAKIKSEPGFAFAYILDPTTEKVESLQYIAKKLNKRIITFSDPQMLSNFDPTLLKDCNYIENATIEDWVYHIINCDFAFVDSFHGTCFSLIFEKNFVSLANPFRGTSRFTSLGKQFGIEDRIFYDVTKVLNNDAILAPIDYQPINAKLNNLKKFSRDWLYNALNSPKDDSTLSPSDFLYRDINRLQARLSSIEHNLTKNVVQSHDNIFGKLTKIGNVVLDIHPTAKILIKEGAELICNTKLPKGSSKECTLILHENATLNVNGRFELSCDTVLQIFPGGVLTLNSGHVNVGGLFAIKHNTIIGNGFLSGRNFVIEDSDYHQIIDLKTNAVINTSEKGITIGEHVWCGEGVTILKEVTIGGHSVIGAKAVVTKDIPPHVIAVGCPARAV
ncbi:MAG: polysaccharide pyruvyl transferase family protein, partial [Tannerella sp.]|nr:polysaccharide pyruvyl transferase family protein [Tannerella sp.]